jgi:hypothetical protein
MHTAQSIGSAVVLFILLTAGGTAPVLAQDNQQDLSPCTGSGPEPTQSASWPVSFCNRTGHDIVIEFHDNDCPAQNWGRRGDVYQRTLRKGESKTLPLCYANEPQQAKGPPPGVPTLRIPGGKGVVTTWTVVGDCGDRSKSLNLDARTFYDRGDYKTGIILLQYPAGASHCFADTSSGSGAGPAVAAPAVAAPAMQTPAVAAAPAPSSSAASVQSRVQPQSPVASQPPAVPRAPALTATIDTQDVVGRTVQVFANGSGAPGYKCDFTLALTFTDGGSWNDRVKASVSGTEGNTPVATRKYLKSVAKVGLTSTKCSPL